jgi:prephenate dehydrogenase
MLITDGDPDQNHAPTRLEETLDLLGARVTHMTAAEHDRVMALISHLPQIVSSALAAVNRDQPDADVLVSLSGTGYRDMTRLASSSWSMWGDILATNSRETVSAIDALVEKLAAVRDDLRHNSGRVDSDLTITRELFGGSGPA